MLRLLPGNKPSTPRLLVAVLTMVGLASASCGGADIPVEYLGDGSLGTVEMAPGEAIQIRSVYTNPGDIALLGNSVEKAIVFAVEDYGTIHGFEVDLGVGLSEMCSPEGGMIAGSLVVAEGNVLGAIGTRCSGAAVEASPLITGAGMVLISPSNTAPSLTSDLAGHEGESHFHGYYRTAHNDLVQGRTVARFFNAEGISRVAVVHEGDAYTRGLAVAFSDAFEERGGSVTGVWEVEHADQDLLPVLTEISESDPEALFFPVRVPTGGYLVGQAADMPAFSETVFMAADALLYDSFLSLPESEGIYISGPDTRYGENTNQSTGWSAAELVARYQDIDGEPPEGAYWGHAYDATVLLLDAIAASSFIRSDDVLVVDRAGLRQYLDSLSGFQGITGELSCDEFGDCGASRVVIHEHLDSTNLQATRDSVVFEAGP